MFTIDTESGFQDVVFITSSYGLGETVVQGAVNPDEFYVFKPTLAQGHFPIVGRRIGSKLIKMEFDPERPGGRAVRTVDVPVSERNRYSLTDDEVNELAATPSSSKSTTAARWTSSGAATASTARSTSCRPVPRR